MVDHSGSSHSRITKRSADSASTCFVFFAQRPIAVPAHKFHAYPWSSSLKMKNLDVIILQNFRKQHQAIGMRPIDIMYS